MLEIPARLPPKTVSADTALRRLQLLKMLKEPFLIRRNWPPEFVG